MPTQQFFGYIMVNDENYLSKKVVVVKYFM
jgi:hypothetical protein